MKTNSWRKSRLLLPALLVVTLVAALLVTLAVHQSNRAVPNAGNAPDGYDQQQVAQRDDRYLQGSRLQIKPGADDTVQVTYLGDSITNEGYYASSEATSYRGIVQRELGRRFNTSLVRYGYAGAKTRDVVGAVPSNVPKSSVVVIEVGTNDVSDIAERPGQGQQYRQLLERIRSSSPDAALVCLGPWGSDVEPSVDSLNQVQSKACVAAGGRFVSISYLYDDSTLRGPPGIALGPGSVSDNFHPNDAGHARIAAALLGQLKLPDPKK